MTGIMDVQKWTNQPTNQPTNQLTNQPTNQFQVYSRLEAIAIMFLLLVGWRPLLLGWREYGVFTLCVWLSTSTWEPSVEQAVRIAEGSLVLK